MFWDALTKRRQELPPRIQALYARWELLETIAEQMREERLRGDGPRG
jgi:hypothetical protein